MGKSKCPDDEFIQLIETIGVSNTAIHLGIDRRGVQRRRDHMEKKYHRNIVTPTKNRDRTSHPARIQVDIEDGIILIGSDAHYWPGEASTAHRAFVKFCKKLKPKIVVMNGDMMDGASISRHPPIGWESRPTVIDEIETIRKRLREIEYASKDAKHIWPLGNHDARYETRLAHSVHEYSKVHGMHLNDHFPEWISCWSVFVNDDLVIKHRFKGGTHATHANTMWSGRSMATSHLHSLKVTPFSDYNGIRWGVDTGTLADPFGPQFTNYTEDAPRNHRSGFIALTFRDGELMWPEIIYVRRDGVVEFRSELIEV